MRFDPRSVWTQIILLPVWKENASFFLVYFNPGFLGRGYTSKYKHLCVVLVSFADMLETLS